MSTQTQINGPGKSDLMFSLFDGKVIEFSMNKNPNQTKLKINEKVKVRITAIEMEDGSGNSWLFKAVDQRTKQTITGYYHSDRRKGHSDYNKKKFNIVKKF